MVYLIRSIHLRDLEPVLQLALQASPSMTSLPKNPLLLQEKIAHAILSFNPLPLASQDETYLFVLEDFYTKKIGGICGLISHMGARNPRFFFQIEQLISNFPSSLPICQDIALLRSFSYEQGPSEICTLFLDPTFRQAGLGRLLSLSRFLFMACFPQRFHSTVIAALQGFIDQEGKVPFWEGLGRHFFPLDFYEVMIIHEKDQTLIPPFLAHDPIYINLLTPTTQAAIGKTHPQTQPALQMLHQEGFLPTSYIDVFDGGPLLLAPFCEIRTIKESVVAPIKEITPLSKKWDISKELFLLSNERLDFRATLSSLTIDAQNRATVPEITAQALEVQVGESIRYANLRPASHTLESHYDHI